MRESLSTFLIASLLKRGGGKGRRGREGSRNGGCRGRAAVLPVCVCATFGQVENARRRRRAEEGSEKEEEVVGT